MRTILLGAALALVSTAALAQGAPAGDAKAGLAAFNKYGCYTCHGIWGQGTLRDGPHIHAADLGYEAVKTNCARRATKCRPIPRCRFRIRALPTSTRI